MKQKTTPLKRITRKELADMADATAGMVYIVIGPNAWGRSVKAWDAMRNAKRNGGRGTYALHLVNEAAEVDRVDGALSYDGKNVAVRLNIGKIIANGY